MQKTINLKRPLDRLPRKTKKIIVKQLAKSGFADVPKHKRYRFWFYNVKKKMASMFPSSLTPVK